MKPIFAKTLLFLLQALALVFIHWAAIMDKNGGGMFLCAMIDSCFIMGGIAGLISKASATDIKKQKRRSNEE